MKYLLYFSFSLILVVLQTTFLSDLLIRLNFYDLVLPFVLYLGLYRPLMEGLPIILLSGFIMDALSGGPFGIYISVYFWSYLGMRWLLRYLHAGSIVLFPFIVSLTVLLESMIIILAVFVYEKKFIMESHNIKIIFCQAAWAGVTAPFILMTLRFFQNKWMKWLDSRRVEREI